MKTTLPIDSNVPLPKGTTRNTPLYPWLTMKPGDSFAVSGKVAASAARGSFRRYQKMGLMPINMSVMQRISDEGSDQGVVVRLWLVRKA